MRLTLISGVLLIISQSCVKPYDFESVSYEQVLVVDATISDSEGPYEVILSYTYPIEVGEREAISGASVQVVDGDGAVIEFEESAEGSYYSPLEFRGEAGMDYRLEIDLPNGSTYQSEFVKLLPSPAIDSIYGRYAVLPDPSGEQSVGGLQFFVDSYDEAGQSRYFRYEWEETYLIRVPFPAQYRFFEDSSFEQLEIPIGICYDSAQSSTVIYGSTVGSINGRMAEFPVRFVSGEEQTLREKYTLLVRQYAISEDAYFFYKRLKENNESGGSLFDRQTGTILGNITSVEDPEEPVLGYFEVSGVTELRRFFIPRMVDRRLKVAGFPYRCTEDGSIITSLDSVLYYLDENPGHNVYSIVYPSDRPPEASLQSKTCTNCSWYANNIKPSYWED